jgi:hypothetical protein
LIKKAGECKTIYEIQSENLITFNEMKAMFKKAKNMQEKKIIPICRRLSMNKDNFISLDQM